MSRRCKSKSLPFALILVSVLCLNGCVSLAPPYVKPPLPVAKAYPEPARASPDAGVDGRNAESIGWQDYFTNPQLQQLIAVALAHNSDMRTAILRVDEARANYGIQRADQFPSISAGVSGTRSRVPGDLNLTGRPIAGNEFDVGVNLSSWELDFWGRVRSLKDAALENFLATDAARRAVSIALVEQVADSFLSLREIDERVALTRKTIISRQDSYRIFKRRFEVGSISRLDLTQVETLLDQAQVLGAQLEQSRAAQAHALSQLVGAETDLTPAHFGDTGIVQELRAGLPSQLLVARPDIIAAEHQLRAAHANIGAARAAFFPRIVLTGSLASASTELDGLFRSGSSAWNFAPSLSLPIFDGGRNRSGLELAEVRRNLAVVNYEKTIQTAFREVSDALSDSRWLAAQVRIQQGTLATQIERARLAKLRYDSGATFYLEVLDAQRDLLSAEQQLVQVRRALLSSKVHLYSALGGGALDSSALNENPAN